MQNVKTDYWNHRSVTRKKQFKTTAILLYLHFVNKKCRYKLLRNRPIIYIPIEQLQLDVRNPRFGSKDYEISQMDIQIKLYNEFDLEDLALSFSQNGYFAEEPIVVVPDFPFELLPFETEVDLKKRINSLLEDKKNKFVVVEGNRRIATIKILLDKVLRGKLGVNRRFPVIEENIATSLSTIPSIFYDKREDVSNYLGVRHITGLLKWESYAKAMFIYTTITSGNTNKTSLTEEIEKLKKQLLDRSDVVLKHYISYQLAEIASDKFGHSMKDIRAKFSLILVAINSPSIRKFIGLEFESVKKKRINVDVIETENNPNFDLLMTWIFGKGKGTYSIINDSRKIVSRLAPILANKEATDYLISTGQLEEAFSRSNGEKDYLLKLMHDAETKIQLAMGLIYKYEKDSAVRDQLHDLKLACEEVTKRYI